MKIFRFLILTLMISLAAACSASYQTKLENHPWLYQVQLESGPLEYEVVFNDNKAAFQVNQSQLMNRHFPSEAREYNQVADFLDQELASFDFEVSYEVEKDRLYLTKDNHTFQEYKIQFTNSSLLLSPLTETGEEDSSLEPLSLLPLEYNEESNINSSPSTPAEGSE